jgi:enoyl-CoA hydratase
VSFVFILIFIFEFLSYKSWTLTSVIPAAFCLADLALSWNPRELMADFKFMNYENILLEKKDAIAYVTVNRPKVLNALNLATMEELRAAFLDIKDDASIRAAILTGSGEKAFVAGADIGELAKQGAVSAKEYTHRGQSVLDLMENLGKPVIACINGFALGGGCELALACTLRLASDTARLGQPEVKLGIMPGYGGSQRLPRLVGKGIANQLLLTGEMITAQEAHRIGLVYEVTSPAELIPRAQAIAQKIIANAPLAVQYTLEAVNKGMEMTQAEGLYLEAILFGICCATEDKTEGTTAFLQKRPAQFQGK